MFSSSRDLYVDKWQHSHQYVRYLKTLQVWDNYEIYWAVLKLQCRILKMEATRYSEKPVNIYQTTRPHSAEEQLRD